MTEQAISPLRRRMIEDMTIRKFAQKTQHDYVQRVKDFTQVVPTAGVHSGCRALARSGQQAAPPSPAMNSRRLIRSPRRHARGRFRGSSPRLPLRF
jgi:hypothetical protein